MKNSSPQPSAPAGQPSRFSLADIAREANVCKMTVSRVLRRVPSVDPVIAARVLKTAHDLGYVPNPKVTELMGYLRKARRVKEQGTLAFIHCCKNIDQDSDIHYFRRYVEGARSQAMALGYQLEEFKLHNADISSKRLESILYNRGIEGLVFSPSDFTEGLPDWDWSRFSVASIGGTNRHPLHLTSAHDNFGAMELACEAMGKNGWKKVGCLLLNGYPRHVMRSWEAGFWAFSQYETFNEAKKLIYHLPTFDSSGKEEDYPAVLRWIRKHSIDGVIANYPYRLIDFLRSEGISVGKEVGVCGLDWVEHFPLVTGVDQCYGHLGATAVKLVADKIRSHETGVPQWSTSIVHSGVWQEGKTA